MSAQECANPLLLGWLKEWLDQAREHNSKGVRVYKKAYNSMKACPLTFNHPSEAQQLNGFGVKLCDRLTDKLKQYCAENGLPAPEAPHNKGTKANKRSGETAHGLPEERPKKAAKRPKPYVPILRSGPYALLMGLSTLAEDCPNGLTKPELIEVAQDHCDSSFTAPTDPTKFYTAWNSMKTLLHKDLVYEYGRPTRKYLLTEDGWETAKRIRNTVGSKAANSGDLPKSHQELDNKESSQRPPILSNTSSYTLRANDAIGDDGSEQLRQSAEPTNVGSAVTNVAGQRDTTRFTTQDRNTSSNPTSISTSKPITLPPGSFTIELVLDFREIRSRTDRDYVSNELTRRGVTPIVRSLELGDILWVAKCKDSNFLASYGEQGDEVTLDWIVERKRLDDLIGSIKDGRFHEQKFRLRRSGAKNVIYLIEEFGADPSASGQRFQEAVASAIASTQVVNGYFVKTTRHLDDTIRYLARMTTLLRNMYTASTTSNSQKPNTISVIPTKSIDSPQTYLQLLERLRAEDHRTASPHPESTMYATTFPTFSALNSKSEMLSLRDVFLKMLMCTRGVTGDKALEIQRRWRTPREFIEAFEELDKENKQGVRADRDGKKPGGLEDMLASQMNGLVGRKKVGKALGKRIAEVWAPHG